jgi:hypothetical protein
MRISDDDVAHRKANRMLLCVQLHGGDAGFPAHQFLRDGSVRDGVADVVAAGVRLDPWALLSILVDEVEDDTGGTLLERLDEPAVLADVLNRLATYGEHVAA